MSFPIFIIVLNVLKFKDIINSLEFQTQEFLFLINIRISSEKLYLIIIIINDIKD